MAEGRRAGEIRGKNSYQNKLKKRKRKFLANVKGFGKQGNFGRGTHLESDEWNYYINILDAIKRGFESLEDKSNSNECHFSKHNELGIFSYFLLFF